jgi:hypothetical protein
MRLRPFSGTKRVAAMAAIAVWRSVAPIPLAWPAISPSFVSSTTGISWLPSLSGRSIGTNHCGVQRKITFALDRQECG